MQINYDVWGAPETWETYDVSPITIEIFDGKLPVFDNTKTEGNIDRYDIKSALDAGKMTTYQPIDVSVCPWRIRGDSYFLGDFQRVAFLPGTGGARYTFITNPVYDEQTRTIGAPVALTWGNAPAIPPKMLHYKYIWGDDFDVTSPMYAGDWAPLVDFNYQKICVVPYVVAYDSNQSQTVKIPLSTYIANGGVSRYRYIQGLVPQYYVGGAGAWTGTSTMLRLRSFGANVDPFEVTGRDEYAETFLTYGDGIMSNYVIGSTQSNGFTDFNGSDVQSAEADSYAAQLTNNNTIYYRSIPENWYLTDRGAGVFITEYDNVNNDFSVDWIIEQFLTLGLWVYTGANIADFDPENPDEYAYAPIFDEYGTTTGRGANGAAALETPAGTWTNNVQGENVYKGNEPPFDPTKYDPENKTIFNSFGVPTETENVYALSYTDDVMKYFYLESWNMTDVDEAIKTFANISPIDCVHSLTLFPIQIVTQHNPSPVPDVRGVYDSLTLDYIKFANVTSTAQGYVIPEQSAVIDMGYIDVARYFGDFRDYEPYTSLMLYLPFCGFTQIDCSTFMGKKLKIKYIVDWISGGCTACILANNLVVQTVNGQIGIQIPLTGAQSAQIKQAIDAAQLQYKQSQTSTAATIAALSVGAIATAATGGAAAPLLATVGAGAGIMAGAVNAGEKLDFALQHITTPFKTVGGSSSSASMKLELYPRLIIARAKMLDGYDATTFGRTNGFACVRTGTLSDFRGYTQCASVNLDGINATAEEKTAINKLLLQGVIV